MLHQNLSKKYDTADLMSLECMHFALQATMGHQGKLCATTCLACLVVAVCKAITAAGFCERMSAVDVSCIHWLSFTRSKVFVMGVLQDCFARSFMPCPFRLPAGMQAADKTCNKSNYRHGR